MKKLRRIIYPILLIVLTISPSMTVHAATDNERSDILRSSEWTNSDGGSICVSDNNGQQINSQSKTVVLDPGHDGITGDSIDPISGLLTTTTTNNTGPNGGERAIVFRVANKAKTQLEQKGYKVILTKQNETDTVTHQDRAKIANDAKADLAVSIHTMGTDTTWGEIGEVYPQRVGLYRVKPSGEKYSFSLTDIAQKSQLYSEIFKNERNKTENNKVIVTDNNFDGRADEGKSGGNISNVQLLSKIPWVYLEAGQNNISEDNYASSIVNATVSSIPLNTASNNDQTQDNATPSSNTQNNNTPTPGQANPYYELSYPSALNEFTNEELSGAINKLISEKEKEKGSTSPFSGLGSAFIDGGKKSNVNPFLAMAHLSVENNYAMNNDNPNAWHLIPGSNNAFGRTATNDQPNVKSVSGRLIYAWSSWQDSLSGEDSWFVYTRRKIDNGSWPNNLRDYIYAYAPPSENNTEQYVSDVKDVIKKLAGYAGDENIEQYADYSSEGGSQSCNSSSGGGSVVQIAEAQVGKKEEGSSNCGDEIEVYFKETNQSCGIPWCAVFVNWVFKEAGQPIGGGALAKGVGQWFEDNKFFFSWKERFRPQPGDIFVKGRGSSGAQLDGGIGHIGIVVEVNGYQITTVEGNSSNAVSKRNYRDYRAIPSLVGFGRYIDADSVQPEQDFDPTVDSPTEEESGVTED